MNQPALRIHDTNPDESGPRAARGSRLARLEHAIVHAAHLLPSQGPITVFVHHNTLHAFEDLPFEQGLRAGLETYGCEPFLPEDHYRNCLVTGRIHQDDLATVLHEDLGDAGEILLGFLGTRFNLRMAMLEYPLQTAPSAELRWLVAETDALRRFRGFVHGPTRLRMVAETRHWVMRDLRQLIGNDVQVPAEATALGDRQQRHIRDLLELFGKSAIESWSDATWESFCLHLLWRICLEGSHSIGPSVVQQREAPVRLAELLREATGRSSDQWVNDFLIRFCAAFLDQGYANWRLPERERGFFRAFTAVYGQAWGPPDRWLRGLRRELERQVASGHSPLESVDESLELAGIAEGERDAFIRETLLALPGWTGMLWQMETSAEWTLFPAPAGTLTEYLAVRLILDRLAEQEVARQELGWRGGPKELRSQLRRELPELQSRSVEQHAFLAFQLAQVRGWLPHELHRLGSHEWRMLVRELDEFNGFERRRVLHRAYERRYRNQTLDALATHGGRRVPWAHESSPLAGQAPTLWTAARGSQGSPADSFPAQSPSVQIICCIDDREESFRRHLEEIDPACETFGAAGFFGVAMYYRGASDAHARPLCPVVIKPRHYVNEEVAYSFVKEHRRRAETRRMLGSASHQVQVGSRTILGGVLTALAGSLASVPMVARILFPRATAQIRRLFGGLVRPPAITQLQLERDDPEPGPGEGHVGYTLEEMTDIVERLLRDIGLVRRFAPLVILFGHGSSSLNNPHESAYNCGACSGGRGGPNARALAEMANDRRVRENLQLRGLEIPEATTFIGSFHNTCDDSVTFFDLDRLPSRHRQQFEQICDTIDEARRRNAHERCRRFESAPLSLSFEGALRHVEARSEDLSQARPEYNHATNAVCLVGQRWWSRGLFLDRRAFLQSYDPSQDDEQHTILARILAAVIPVCAGISLEYYFSSVDNAVLGCGSKLPHNITSLLGVMEGAASDLRPGLSQQMIEIHEPMRILFVIETTPEAMLSILERNPVVGTLCRNEWVQLAVIEPRTRSLRVFQDGAFKPYRQRTDNLPRAKSSADWYRGWRDHLGLAEIEEPAQRPELRSDN
ncbi:MAG: DUF2309 domain-containing protein [Pirellulaceae bacterium]|nr:DUF2309 domain-containing protein [Pirellulaceae bacterium]